MAKVFDLEVNVVSTDESIGEAFLEAAENNPDDPDAALAYANYLANTGNLDEAAGARVMDHLLDLAAQEGAGLLYVTHSREQAARADRVLQLRDGRLATESVAP